jgi:hypothetical protein
VQYELDAPPWFRPRVADGDPDLMSP